MNMNSVEAHTMKAMAVEELAKKVNVQILETSVTNQEKPYDSELMALANNPHLVEGHLQKWRAVK